MPAMIRTSGHMWGPDGDEADTLAVIPDSSYAGIYQVVIDDCRANGAYDPTTMGSVPNVGLMAQAAEEYGSHDKTFEIPTTGTVRVVDGAGDGSAGARGGRGRHLADVPDQGRPDPGLGQARRHAGPGPPATPAVFWLDEDARARRQPDRQGAASTCPSTTPTGLDITIMAPVEAIAFSLERIRRGEDTISVTGNVLRDYLTDLFPILELGTVGQDAVGGAADQRRRPVRDRRRRLGAQARAAAGQGELPALGQPRRVPGPGRVSLEHLAAGHRQRAGPGAGRHPRPGHRDRSSTRTSRRPAGSARSTTAAATSTWRCTGPRSWPRRPTTPSWPPTFAELAKRAAGATSRRSPRSCSPSRARRPTSAATTVPTTRWPPP